VVDNGSQDDSVERIRRECPAVRLLLSDHNLGFAAGNNLAIRQVLAEGQATCLLLLNNDAVIGEEVARRLLDTLSRTQAGIVGSILRDPPPDMDLQAAGGLNPLWRVDTHMRHIPDTVKPYAVDYVPGTAILIAAEAFERVGLLDEDYFISGEIADFCLRARRHGYRPLIDPTVTVYHDTGRSSELRVAFYTYYFLRNRFLFVRKFHPRLRWLLVPYWTLFGLMSRFLFVRKFHPRLRWLLVPYWTLFGLMSVVTSWLRGNPRRARALLLGLRHGLSEQFGDRSTEVLALK
jgi:GT2 family glycosyltransferase